jgi:hypothetical protein
MTLTEIANDPLPPSLVAGQLKPACAYCEQSIEEPKLIFVEMIFNGFCLHRNCVIAFAARIQNEFEKL